GNLSNLTHLYLYSNQLTEAIPKELGSLNNLIDLKAYLNQLTGEIPKELGNLSSLSYLNFGDNQLTGEIPAELGNLSNLQNLFLYNNKLTGSIPSTLGNLHNISFFDLKDNQLSGSIPKELTNMTFNSSGAYSFNLSNNNLSGTIPNFTNINVKKGYISSHGFDIYDNNFTFSDIEPNYLSIINSDGINGTNANNGYDVSKQYVMDTNRTLDPLKTEEKLTIVPALTENPSGHDIYQWFKDGIAIEGATSRIYTKDNITLNDAGIYTYEIKNSVIKELTLQSHNKDEGITISISDVRAEVIEDIAGNKNGIPATAEQINAISGVSGAKDGIDYSIALAAAKDATPAGYANPADPTSAEIQAVINSVNALNEVVEDIAGNKNGISVTAKQINYIRGVSGAISGVDYSEAL
ncbi:MAG: hypothetical protein KAU90_06975, partial [Sulfurovaceae bacterium]|nr:hypothetical protein [Sulfurovaceae bacterium]